MKVKIDLNSAKFGAIEIISDPTQSKFQVSDFSLSVYEIPTLEVIFPINESQKRLLNLEKGDKISLSFDINDDGNFFTKFSGEINTQEITLNEDRTRILKVEVLSPFMRLQDILEQIRNQCMA